MALEIVTMQEGDWPQVQVIYSEGIATGNATFETSTPDWSVWDAGHRKDCRLVAKEDRKIVGWAALRPVSSRPVYAGVAEVSIYVAADARSRGVGNALLKSLIGCSEHSGVWTLQAGVFAENVASLVLHKSCGFREVGLRQRLGQLAGVWRDVLLLERRSSSVGI